MKPKVDTPLFGSWAHEEKTRPKKQLNELEQNQLRSGVLIQGVVLYTLKKGL